MTDSEKATALLSYLDGLDTKTVINILHPMCSDGDLAEEYDRLVGYGIVEEPKQKARLIAVYSSFDKCWETLTNEYEDWHLDKFVERVKFLYPEIIRNDYAEIEGEIQNANEHYILTWEDGIGEVVRIYEKV